MKADSKPLGCMVKCVLNPVNGLGKALAQNQTPCGMEMVCREQLCPRMGRSRKEQGCSRATKGFNKVVLIASTLGDEKADAELSL